MKKRTKKKDAELRAAIERGDREAQERVAQLYYDVLAAAARYAEKFPPKQRRSRSESFIAGFAYASERIGG